MSDNPDSEMVDQADISGYEDFEPRMQNSSLDKLNIRRTVLLSASFFTVLMAWNFFNMQVPILLDGLVPAGDGQDTIIGVIMALDNFVAVLLQPFFGNLSDKTRSKWGRRMPFIIVGTGLSAIFFSIIPWIQVLSGFIVIVLLFDVSMSIYRSPSVAIIPDYTPDKFRSKASGLQQFIANMGGVLAFGTPMVIGFFNLTTGTNRIIGFTVISVIMVIMLIIQIILLKETPTGTKFFEKSENEIEINSIHLHVRERLPSEKQPEKINIYKEIGDIFKRDNKDFKYMLLACFFMYLGFAGIESVFSRFAINYVGIPEEEVGGLFMAYSVPMIAVAYLMGIFGQKFGRKKAIKISLFIVMITSAIMSFVVVPMVYKNPNKVLIMVVLACISAPWMGFIVNSFPVIWALSPEGKVGSYSGIYYTFNQLAYTLSPIIIGVLLDLFNGMGDRRFSILFPTVLVCVIIAQIFMFQVKGGDEDLDKNKLEEFQKKYQQDD
jgi:maltose/moltooligosaccharide transporter